MSDSESLIQLWRQRLAAISANANELADAESTKRIRIKARTGQYSGQSKLQAELAIAKLSKLTDDYVLLANVVEEAVSINQGGIFTSWANKEEKVLALLEGSSIVRNIAKVAISDRALLGTASVNDSMTPEALLVVMQTEFEIARDALREIDLAESRGMEELASLKQDYAVMEQRARRLNSVADRPSFIDLPDLQSDPLNAQNGKESLQRALVTWSAKLDEIELAKTRAMNEVELAKRELQQLQQLSANYQAQLAQLHAMLDEPELHSKPRLQADLQTEMLVSWCGTLESSLQAGAWTAVNVGAVKLQQAIAEAINRANLATAEVRARQNEPEELKGRFVAYKAKDNAITLQKGADQSRQVLRAQIEAEWQVRPLNLERLRQQLAQYQAMLTK